MSIRDNPLLSVIIPTRERPDTLAYTIKTALDQGSQNFEVVISDNFSQDNTAEVVRGFSDARIRLINPGRRLAMSDHWDFALLHAAGDYVLFIGDDDGILPGGLDKLEACILSTRSAVYCWPTPIYEWPMDGKPARIVHFPGTTQTSEINLEDLVRRVVAMGGWRQPLLPCMYHSAVAKRIPDSIRQKTGRVFHSTQPDVFMSMVVPVFAKTAIDLGCYVSVPGHSAKSNGAINRRSARDEHFCRFIQEYGDYKIHPTLFPGIPLGLNLTPDSLLSAMDKFPDFYGATRFNYDAMLAFLLESNRIVYKYKLSALDVIAKRHQIQRYHPLHVSRFLLYWAFHQSLRVWWKVLWLAGVRPPRPPAPPLPDNIADFVKSLSGPKSVPDGLGRSK